MNVDLDTDAPRSPDYTHAVAAAFAEAVRVLNHHTLNHRGPGLEYPSDVYRVLGELADGAHRLPQLLQQLDRFLAAEHEDGRVGEDADGRHGGDADLAVTDASDRIHGAKAAAAALAQALQDAYAATARLHQIDGLDP